MSEFQYYEFQAVDRPLTRPEMAELRKYSTRARITPTSFVNDYQWGDFKGNQDAWMERYKEKPLADYIAGKPAALQRLQDAVLGPTTSDSGGSGAPRRTAGALMRAAGLTL